MSKYHIKKDGSPGLCKATHNCPLGDANEHYNSVEEAQQYSDYLNNQSEAVLGAFPDMDENNIRDYLKYRDRFQQLLDEYEEEKEELDNLDNTSDEWFDRMNANRKRFFKAKKYEEVYENLKPKSQKDMEKNLKVKSNPFRRNRNYNFHPDVSNKTRNDYKNIISAYSGLSDEEINSLVKEEMSNGVSETEAYRNVFANVPLRQDKPIVAIDLETDSLPTEKMNSEFDRGPRTEIIEVGYSKIYPDGRVEKKSALYGVDNTLFELAGSGAVNIHNIQPEEIQGKTSFIDNKEAQKELINDLKGSVLLAHNARFEIGQLGHSLRGFNKAMNDGDIEVLDTMNVSKYYMPDNERNTNENFVQATGGEYEGAHRALADADMSFNALMRFKGGKEI